MSLLPELLRRLARAAHDKNEDIVDETLVRLNKWSGWQPQVNDFMSRMEPQLQSYVNKRIRAATASDDYHGSLPLPLPRGGDSGSPAGYPMSPAAMGALIGGTWTAAWTFDIASGNDAGAFGGVTLTAAGTPLYGITGPRAGTDLAVGVDAAADQFTGADNFNVTATDDLCLAWVAKCTGAAAADEFMFVKGNAGLARWSVYRNAAGNIILELVSASGVKTAFVSATSTFGQWHAGFAVVDRGGGAGRVAVCPLDGTPILGSPSSLFAETMINVDNFTVLNRNAALPALTTQMAAAYIGVGVGYGSRLSAAADMSSGLIKFAQAVRS